MGGGLEECGLCGGCWGEISFHEECRNGGEGDLISISLKMDFISTRVQRRNGVVRIEKAVLAGDGKNLKAYEIAHSHNTILFSKKNYTSENNRHPLPTLFLELSSLD